MFRRNIHAAIDGQIKEAMLKPLTAENLNYLSDLYLRKGEKDLAIECLYNSISKLHVSQRDKMIAIYKKIIKLAPGDERAYKGLIDIFAKMGLVAEEVNHLILITKVYQSRGDYEKVNEVYRRIHLIDPDNEIAAKYFGKGKPGVSPDIDKDDEHELSDMATLLSGHPEVGDLTGFVPESPPAVSVQEELSEDWSPPRSVDTLADESHADQAEWEDRAAPPVVRNKRVYLIIGITVLLISLAAGTGFFMYKKILGGIDITVQKQQKPAVPQGTGEGMKKAGGITIAVARISADGAGDSGLDKAVGPAAFSGHQFYSVTVQAATGCIPDEVVRDPLRMISFIGGTAAETKPAGVPGLESMSRMVYRATVPGCGENKAVFMKIFIAHPKGQQHRGIAVKMIEKGATETITWD
ncbi:MAG: hypothetical protein C0402_00345 [Thermodesulfovibrio sp.]|nr:hypothetical protein [Thermodesulfovibrio sp.]